MKNLSLKAQKVEEVQFVNKIRANTKIELKNGYAYNVRYTNQNLCEGKLTVTISDKNNPDSFSLKLILAGIFEYNADVEREVLHVQTYKELFPYARAYITNLTATAGIAPITIPDIDIENREIYRFDNPAKPSQE